MLEQAWVRCGVAEQLQGWKDWRMTACEYGAPRKYSGAEMVEYSFVSWLKAPELCSYGGLHVRQRVVLRCSVLCALVAVSDPISKSLGFCHVSVSLSPKAHTSLWLS